MAAPAAAAQNETEHGQPTQYVTAWAAGVAAPGHQGQRVYEFVAFTLFDYDLFCAGCWDGSVCASYRAAWSHGLRVEGPELACRMYRYIPSAFAPSLSWAASGRATNRAAWSHGLRVEGPELVCRADRCGYFFVALGLANSRPAGGSAGTAGSPPDSSAAR